eukprot:66348_1
MSHRQCLLVCLLLFNVLESQLNCTSNDTNTCFIDLNTSLNDSNRDNITCSPSLPNCAISCDARDSCSTTILCPPDGDTCTIHCKTLHACSDSTVLSGSCQTVSLHIDGNTQYMQLHAPGNTGSLSINISQSITFYHNTITTPSNTSTIRIQCEGDCSENTIHALSMNGQFNLDCLSPTSRCDMNTIYCPDDCNILCNECPDTKLILSDISSINDMQWTCDTDCTDSSLSTLQNDTWTWQECVSDGWVLSDIVCDNVDTMQTTVIIEEDEGVDQTITILAFVLIGTVIGCLCVILVTTIICCICWHESQIKALNMGDKNNKNGSTQRPHKLHDQQQKIQSRGATPPSFPADDSTTPAPQSVSVPAAINTNIYKPARHSYSPEPKVIPAITPPKVRKTNGFTAKPQRQVKKPIKKKRDHGMYEQAPQQQQHPNHPSSSSGENHLQKATAENRQSNNHKRTSNNNRRSSGRNSNQNRNHSRSPESPPDDPVQQPKKQHKKPNKIKVTIEPLDVNETHRLAAEAEDDLFPLENDRIGPRYDEHGRYNKYAGRKQHKDSIRMQLAAYPSNISDGTTGTEEMKFVGTNYHEYNPADQNNSYFKDEEYGHDRTKTNITSTTVTTQWSLGNLDSQSSDQATEVTDPTTEPLTPTTATSFTSTAITSPGINSQQYQGHHGNYQGHNNIQNMHGHKENKKRNIHIMEPQKAGQKVKQQVYQRQHYEQDY